MQNDVPKMATNPNLANNLPENIVFFGESGSGKSSLINTIVGRTVAEVSDQARGCTFTFQCYKFEDYNLYDTVGLSEGSRGMIDSKTAIKNLVKFLKSLENGVSLLVFVMKKGRITKTVEENYKLFVKGICDEKVPVLLVITHCELEAKMGQWWQNNKKAFDDYELKFTETISACATRGEGLLPSLAYVLQNRNDETNRAILGSIKSHALNPPWKMEGLLLRLTVIIQKFFNILRSSLHWPIKAYYESLKSVFVDIGYDNPAATKAANDIVENVLFKNGQFF